MNWPTIRRTRRNCNLPKEGRSPRFACVNSLEVLVRPANFRRTVMALGAPEVQVRSDLFKSGFVANKGKCQWVPLQVISWLGICWDFKNNRMFIPPDKISGILEEVVEIMSCCSISVRKLARVTGRIISNFFIMGDVCKLMTKSLHRLIECRRVWDALLVLDADVLLELWGEHLRFNCRPI